jgi:hypothetical protein
MMKLMMLECDHQSITWWRRFYHDDGGDGGWWWWEVG